MQILKGIVTHVMDGDTIAIEVKQTFRIRLAGINAAELSSKDPKQAVQARFAKDRLTSKVIGQQVLVAYEKLDDFGRYLGQVILDPQDKTNFQVTGDGEDINQWLLDQKLAEPLPEPKKKAATAKRK